MTPSESHDWLFRKGWVILADEYNWSESKSRAAVGKLIKAAGGDSKTAMRAVMGIQDKRPVDPMPWALAGIAKINEKNAHLHRPGFKPVTKLPPAIPVEERVSSEKFAELREFLESQ